MSEEQIEAVREAYRGGEFQQAQAAASLIDDEIVRKVAFAGTPETAARKLEWLGGEGFDAVSVFPLGADRMATIKSFAAIATAARNDPVPTD
jgi:alkanesulfonate monooxygenase SsuD/methylene tetrahydromethanopterin reductase-like flavin-dependent oxidoreductase (luciferase family)